jgi:hypothetical protein
MRPLLLLALVTAGCNVSVGRGQIAPFHFDVLIDASGLSPPIDLPGQAELLSADQSAQLWQQYGSKLGAIESIDVVVDDLALLDYDGNRWAGATVSVGLENATIAKGQTVRIPDDIKGQLLDAVRQQTALDVTVQVSADWPLQMTPASVFGVLQPVLTVDGLKAL